jgi:shikimate dehydrogenase
MKNKRLNEDDIESVILKVREKKIQGINVTVPFKKIVIPFLDRIKFGSRKYSIR